MKRLTALLMSLVLALGLAGCSAPSSLEGVDLDNALVVYFSATGNTEEAAGYIAGAIGADVFEIVPADPYTSEDLNWNNPESRVSVEHAQKEAGKLEQPREPRLGGARAERGGHPAARPSGRRHTRQLGQLRHRVHRLPHLVVRSGLAGGELRPGQRFHRQDGDPLLHFGQLEHR